ncbi:MAG: universal stress protein [Pseudomonadota bacterium]
MHNATAVYCASVSTSDQVIQTAARKAAEHDTHLSVLLHSEYPTMPIGAHGALPYAGAPVPDGWSTALAAAQGKLKDRIDAVEHVCAAEHVSAEVIPFFASDADIKRGIAHVARTCDIVFFAPDLRAQSSVFHEMLHAVLFQSPAAAMVNGTLDLPHDTVLVAWDDSLAGARAAHVALPYLKEASGVHIVGFDAPATDTGAQIEPGREAATWLSHHGCTVTLTQLPSGGREIATCILEHAREIGADLIVAGAYGHSRLRQAVFGGTSRALIEQTELPVLMAH